MSNISEKETPFGKFKSFKLTNKQMDEVRIKVAKRYKKSAEIRKLIDKDLPLASWEILSKRLKAS